MNGWKRIAAIAALLGLTGCVPIYSLHPFFLEEDVVFEPDLVGRWLDEEGTWWTLRNAGGDGYELIITPPFSDVDRYPSLELTLFRVRGTYFMDFYPGERADCEEGGMDCLAAAFGVTPVHFVAQVGLEGDALSFGFLDDDWVMARIKDGSVDIRHEETEDAGLLLTASTPELQKLLLQAVAGKEAFAVETVLKR